MHVGGPIHTGIFFFGIDVSDWVGLATLIGFIYTFVKKGYKEFQKHSDENSRAMLDSFERTNTHNTDMLNMQLANVSKSLDHMNETFEKFKIDEQNRYSEHEKHLVKDDLVLQQHNDSLEDHENRIKDNEDDINYLKDKLNKGEGNKIENN